MGKRVMAWGGLDEPTIGVLVGRTLDGEKPARAKLWLALELPVEKIARQWRVTSRLHACEDHRRDVFVAVMARLEAKDFERMRTFRDLLQRRDGTASEWFRVLTVRAALRSTEEHPDHLGPAAGDGTPRWVHWVLRGDGLEDDLLPESPRVIETITVREIMAYAERTLPPPQLAALRLWTVELPNAGIAEALNLREADDARKLVHAAHKRLRTHFAGGGDDGTET